MGLSLKKHHKQWPRAWQRSERLITKLLETLLENPPIPVKDFEGVRRVLYWYGGIELIQLLTNLCGALFLRAGDTAMNKTMILVLVDLTQKGKRGIIDAMD